MEHLRFPNESAEYRTARNALLEEEIALRAQIEAVAAKRRALPQGGEVAEDYAFERVGKNRMPERVKMSELFGPHDTLMLYSFMYGPEREWPCPGCTHLLDGMDGAARHIGQRASLFIVAKSPIARLAVWAHGRGWEHLSMLSTAGSYDRGLFRRHLEVLECHADAASCSRRRELGRDDLQRIQEGRRQDQALLGLRDELRSTRAQAASSRRRSRRSVVGSARYDAGRPRRVLSESKLQLSYCRPPEFAARLTHVQAATEPKA